MRTALIDGDIITYRIGFTTEDDEPGIAFWRTSDMIEDILNTTDADSFMVYLTRESDPDAFRKKVYPEYKLNRKQPRPKHYHAIRQFLEVEWNAETVRVIEADDALGIAQTEDTIICSIDKDLLQVPGKHYNFVKRTKTNVTDRTGLLRFYGQLIIGDSSDNIKGVVGSGKKAAEKVLSNLKTEQEMFDAVREMYGNDEEMLMNGRCLWIWRKPNDDWKHRFAKLRKHQSDGIQEEDQKLSGQDANEHPVSEGSGDKATDPVLSESV